MRECTWCNLSEEERKWLLLDNDSWSVYLADEQDYIGRCILVLKRHCGSLAELTDGEFIELKHLICILEHCLKTVYVPHSVIGVAFLMTSIKKMSLHHICIFMFVRGIVLLSF